MTWEIFLKWLMGFDLHVSGRKVFLIMDNFSGHIPLDQLPNHIQLEKYHSFLPTPKRNLEDPTMRCWDHPQLQGVLSSLLQSASSAAFGGQCRRP
jgi:hypothetical protein